MKWKGTTHFCRVRQNGRSYVKQFFSHKCLLDFLAKHKNAMEITEEEFVRVSVSNYVRSSR